MRDTLVAKSLTPWFKSCRVKSVHLFHHISIYLLKISPFPLNSSSYHCPTSTLGSLCPCTCSFVCLTPFFLNLLHLPNSAFKNHFRISSLPGILFSYHQAVCCTLLCDPIVCCPFSTTSCLSLSTPVSPIALRVESGSVPHL